MNAELAKILDQVEAGGRLQLDDAVAVYNEAPTERLIELAHGIRSRLSPPDEVTYLIDRNVNYTNVCITDCKFCEFYRPPGHKEAYLISRDDLYQKMEELRAVGGSRVLLQGGHHPDLPLNWYEQLLTDLRDRFPEIERDAFSPPEIEHMAHVESLPVAEVVARLKAAGLDGIPGGGGEILDDEIRTLVSPKKTKTNAWLEVMEAAHKEKLYTSASQVFGFGEQPIHRVRSLDRLRRQQDESLKRHGFGFMAFISWPLQYESRYGKVFSGIKGWDLGGSDDDYLRHTAFCRIYLDNYPHFQASWPTMGLEVAARALRCGCDDMGGTMMEENVVSQAGSMNCSVTETEVIKTIETAGFRAVRRDANYNVLPPFDSQPTANP